MPSILPCNLLYHLHTFAYPLLSLTLHRALRISFDCGAPGAVDSLQGFNLLFTVFSATCILPSPVHPHLTSLPPSLFLPSSFAYPRCVSPSDHRAHFSWYFSACPYFLLSCLIVPSCSCLFFLPSIPQSFFYLSVASLLNSFTASLPSFPPSSCLAAILHHICHFPNDHISGPLEPERGDEMLSSSYSQWEGKPSHTIDSQAKASILSSSFLSSVYLSSCRSFLSYCNLYTLAVLPPAPVHCVIKSVCHGHERVCEKGRGLCLPSTVCACKFTLVYQRMWERRGEERERKERRN